MSTAQTIVDRALRLIGAIASGESPTPQESADGLVALNALISSWQADKLTVYAYVDTAFNLIVADASYTVGPAGNFALTPRPSKIESAYIRDNSIDYPVRLIGKDEWISIADKSTTADYPTRAYYEPTLATGTLQLWPVPSAIKSLHILTWTTLVELSTLATSITLPQGYERALAYNLALDIAPEYSVRPSDDVRRIAGDSLATIRRMNIRPITGYPDNGFIGAGVTGVDITSDE